jgi:hypothetical protein
MNLGSINLELVGHLVHDRHRRLERRWMQHRTVSRARGVGLLPRRIYAAQNGISVFFQTKDKETERLCACDSASPPVILISLKYTRFDAFVNPTNI